MAVALSRHLSPTRLAGTALLVAVLGSVTLSAIAQPHGPHSPGAGGPGMGMMLGGRGFDRMLDSVNATADQRAQIKAIADKARADLQAQRESGRALHQQMAAAFAAPNVDANAIESLRQQMLQQHDQASRRMTQALVDAARVLTPDQRKQLADKAAQRRSMMERHMQERRSLDGGAASTPR